MSHVVRWISGGTEIVVESRSIKKAERLLREAIYLKFLYEGEDPR